jgi:uncharacterized membrane protein
MKWGQRAMSMPTTDSGTEPKTWAMIVWGLYIASYFTAFITMIVGLIIAYVKRGELAGTPFESHMTSAIRTFWISLIGGIIGAVLLVVGIGFIIWAVLAVWQIFRVIRGMVRAIDGRPIDDPTGWL